MHSPSSSIVVSIKKTSARNAARSIHQHVQQTHVYSNLQTRPASQTGSVIDRARSWLRQRLSNSGKFWITTRVPDTNRTTQNSRLLIRSDVVFRFLAAFIAWLNANQVDSRLFTVFSLRNFRQREISQHIVNADHLYTNALPVSCWFSVCITCRGRPRGSKVYRKQTNIHTYKHSTLYIRTHRTVSYRQ